MAHFKVSASGGTIYLGTLIISIDFDLPEVVHAWNTGEAEYAIRHCRVKDDREQDLSRLYARFPVVPEPVVTELMHAE